MGKEPRFMFPSPSCRLHGSYMLFLLTGGRAPEGVRSPQRDPHSAPPCICL